jgi:hypothetical protein
LLTPNRWDSIGRTVETVANTGGIQSPTLQPRDKAIVNQFLPYHISGADSVSGTSITFPVRYKLKQVKVLINPSTPALTFDEIDSAEEVYAYNVFEFANNGTYAGGINASGNANNYVVNPVGYYFSGTNCSSKGWTRLTATSNSGGAIGHIVYAKSAKNFLASSTDRYVVFNEPNIVDVCSCS